jgi:hypothetical protein
VGGVVPHIVFHDSNTRKRLECNCGLVSGHHTVFVKTYKSSWSPRPRPNPRLPDLLLPVTCYPMRWVL